jgi:hypothetical protein
MLQVLIDKKPARKIGVIRETKKRSAQEQQVKARVRP